MKFIHSIVSAVPVLFLAGTSALFGQTASISGVVTDQSAAVMQGVRIAVTNLDTGLRREAETSDVGQSIVTVGNESGENLYQNR